MSRCTNSLLLLCLLLLSGTTNLIGQTIAVPRQQLPVVQSTATDVRQKSEATPPLESAFSVSSPTTLRLEFTFLPIPHGSQITAPKAPAGLSSFSIPGINLFGFSRELGIRATRVVVESVELVERAFPNAEFFPITDVPLTGDSAVDREAIARLQKFQATGVYPLELAEVIASGQIGELKVTTLKIHPYRYDSQRQVLLWARRIVLRVEADSTINTSLVDNISQAFKSDYRIRAKRSASMLATTTTDNRIAPDGYEYKFFANVDGLYRVTVADLIKLGVPVSSIDARTFRLYNRTIEIPMYVYDRGNNRLDAGVNEEYIEFFGKRKRADSLRVGSDLYYDPFTDYNVYFLVWDGIPGKRMVEEAGDIKRQIPGTFVDLTQLTESFQSTIHLENEGRIVEADLSNTNLNTLSDLVDRYMWGYITSNSLRGFTARIPSPNVLSNEPLKLVAALRGGSAHGDRAVQANLTTPHTAEILLQGQRALSRTWLGDRIAFASSDSNAIFPLSAKDLSLNGNATITVINLFNSTQTHVEGFYANWFEVTYPRLYLAQFDKLDFSVPTGRGPNYYTFNISGFSNTKIRVYREGISRIINIAIVENRNFGQGSARDSGTWRTQFQVYVASEKEKFLALTENEILRPAMLRDKADILKHPDLDYNYVVIVDDSTADLKNLNDANHPLNRFVKHKERNGEFTVKIVRVSDIYDEFSGGAVSPFAIRDFFDYAYHNWRRPLKYALIFGNGTELGSRDPILNERSFVPSLHFQTVQFGATPCDYLMGSLDGITIRDQNQFGEIGQSRKEYFPDFLAEVLTGRVPVASIDHVTAYIDKLIDQEARPDYGQWRNRVLLIGGGEREFANQTSKFIENKFRYSSEPYRVLSSETYVGTAYNRPILPLMNDSGVGLVAYLGHGGGGQWENALAFGTSTVNKLQNANRMPAILSFTCYTGAYSFSYGLMAALMIQPKVGAVVAMGTASFGWLNNNGYLAESIFSILHDSRYRNLSFGEIVALGKAKYVGIYQGINPDVVTTLAAMYTVFGDPSFKIPLTRDTVGLVGTTNVATPGGTIGALGRLRFVPTHVTVSLIDTAEISIANQVVDIPPTGMDLNVNMTVPSTYKQASVGIRIYAYDDNGNSATGSIRYSASTANVVTVTPAVPLRAGQDAVFDVRVSGPDQPTGNSVLVSLLYQNPGQQPFINRPLSLTQLAPGQYRSAPIAGSELLPGGKLTVTVPVPNVVGGVTGASFYLEGGADPAAFPPTALDSTRELYADHIPLQTNVGTITLPNQTIRHNMTNTGSVLEARIFNWGDMDAVDIPYEIFYRDLNLQRIVLGTGVVSVPAKSSSLVNIQVPQLAPVVTEVYIQLTPDLGNRWMDAFRNNNISSLKLSLSAAGVKQGLGFTTDGVTATPYDIVGVGSLRINPASAVDDRLVTTVTDKSIPVTRQSFTFVSIGDSVFNTNVVRFETSPNTEPLPMVTFQVKLNQKDASVISGKALTVVRYDATTRLWKSYPTVRLSSELLATTIPVSGTYAVVVVNDVTGPEIQFSVEGQFFSAGSSVPRDARLSALISDPSGVDTDVDRLQVFLDNVPLRVGVDYIIIDSTITPTTTSVRIQRALEPGKHRLAVEATDRLGNRSQLVETDFEVQLELAVQVYGNFPNPFDKETFIAFEIRGASIVDEVEVKIFTAAGKLIKTMRFPSTVASEIAGLQQGGAGQPTALGYHEAWWDGRDNDGQEVANGVYFYRLRVKQSDTEIEKTGVIARIR